MRGWLVRRGGLRRRGWLGEGGLGVCLFVCVMSYEGVKEFRDWFGGWCKGYGCEVIERMVSRVVLCRRRWCYQGFPGMLID